MHFRRLFAPNTQFFLFDSTHRRSQVEMWKLLSAISILTLSGSAHGLVIGLSNDSSPSLSSEPIVSFNDSSIFPSLESLLTLE